MSRPTLSLVLPLRNEAEDLKDLETHLASWLSAYEIDCEIVLVDDGSSDDTGARMAAWAERDGRVKTISLLRSYGDEGALRAGLDHASGDAIVLIDGDIQDSAEVIPRLVENWRGGSDLVHARRRPTQVGRGLKSLLRKSIHELTDSLTKNGVPQDAANFRLVDRAVVERLRARTPAARNLRGLLADVARAQSSVTFQSIPSKQHRALTLSAELDSAWESITRRSLVPLRFAYVVALFIVAVSVVALLMILLASATKIRVPNSIWIGAILGVVGGAQLFFLGVIGEYIGRIFLDMQKQPAYSLASEGAVRERALPAAPRLAMPSSVAIDDSELEPMLPIAATEPPPPPPRASFGAEGSRPPPPVRASTPPPPRLTPPPGQMHAVPTQRTIKLTHDELKAEVANSVSSTPETTRLASTKIEPIKRDNQPSLRPSNPPLPSKRSSIPPAALGSRPRLDSKTAPPATVSTDTPAVASERPASFMTNASANGGNARTKTLAGIPLPAMLSYAANHKSDSAPPASESGKSELVDRLKEDPKPLNTLHGVPSAEK